MQPLTAPEAPRARHEVSGLAFEFLALACESAGVPFEALLEPGMPPRVELRNRRRRFDWELFVELCDRLAARLGDDAALRQAAAAVALKERPPFASLLPHIAPAAFLGLAKWVPQQVFRVPEFRVSAAGHEVSLSIRVPDDRQGSRAFILFCCTMTEVFVRSVTDAQLQTSVCGPREGKVSFAVSPAQRWGGLSARLALAIARRSLGELGHLASELAETQIERESARERTERAEAFARAVLVAVDDALLIVEPTTLVVRWASPATKRLFGRLSAEATGVSVLELFDTGERDRLEAWMRGAGTERLETFTRGVAGSATRELDLTLVDHRAEPAIGGFLIQARDVTERNKAKRAAQERDQAYASLLKNLKGMAYRCRNDPDWTVELITDGCEELTGYTAEALRFNRDVAYGSLVHPDDSGPLWDKCQANLAARRPCQNEYRIKTRDGRFRWVLDIAHGVYSDDGALIAIEGFVTNVDDRRKLEEQLAHAARIEGLGRLAGGIAHDFNNYLGVVLGLAALVKRKLPEASALRSDVESIESASLKASELTSQLLSFARRQAVRASVVSVNELVLDMERLLQRTLGADIALTTELSPSLWATLIDCSQFEHVLLNLAVNARDAMPTGGKLTLSTHNVTVDASRHASDEGLGTGDWVRITVSDTGQGIQPELKSRIFEPFVTSKAQGTGLGLATAYGTVRQAGGHIEVRSELGKGATFEINLPRTTLFPNQRQSVAPPSPTPTPTRGETILVVDDNAALRSVVSRQLELLGYNVLVAGDGLEALELAHAHTDDIHVVLTDVVMPQMGGHALVEVLQQERPHLRVLYVSGHTEDAVIRDATPARRAAFLAKPFKADDLALRIREVLDRSLAH